MVLAGSAIEQEFAATRCFYPALPSFAALISCSSPRVGTLSERAQLAPGSAGVVMVLAIQISPREVVSRA